MIGGNNQDRYIVLIPMVKNTNINSWHEQINSCFFFSNQITLFDCYLLTMNNQLYVNYNIRKPLSIKFVDFILNNLPKTKKDNKKRFFVYKD